MQQLGNFHQYDNHELSMTQPLLSYLPLVTSPPLHIKITSLGTELFISVSNKLSKMASSLTRKQARAEARSCGINSTGSKSQLIERLLLFQDKTSESLTPTTDEASQGDDERCDAIVSCSIE